MNQPLINFGPLRPRHFMNDEYEAFVEDVDFKFNVIQDYLFELSHFYDQQSKFLLENYKDFEKSDLQKVSMNDPKYALYTGEFQRITISNIFVSLFSLFEYSLMDYIEQLEHYLNIEDNKRRVKNNRFHIPKNEHKRKTVIEMGHYLSSFYEKPNDIVTQIEFFDDLIDIRNAIVHNGGYLSKSKRKKINVHFDIIYNENTGYFELKDIISCLFTVKSMKTFYNSLHLYKLSDTVKE